MRVRVRLYGLLGKGIPGHDPREGMEMDVPEGSTLSDVLDLLGVEAGGGEIVVSGGRVLEREERLRPGATIQVYHSAAGG